ncbi:unnamed protein product [Rotaria sordida]|uniref:Protein kinase domain-containing protein n=1 Tax=Rotaria sordida TaxID=392033 RepID=A0A819VTF7_9BILA|nr:unnamed protein product [Rotaria sordida]CAF1512706.1 unnamed protein product [Rotaria sordida]CAF4078597.1 unnamed protein product [Rotaria sordida]CAF4113443.1 unnamed protein product [Rotaria sordida]
MESFFDSSQLQDSQAHKSEIIEKWASENDTSSLIRQHISLQQLHQNYAIKRPANQLETSKTNENYEFVLDIDVKKKNGRPLFQTHEKTIYAAEWLSTSFKRPDIVILKIDGIQARKEASFYLHLSHHPNIVHTFGFVLDSNCHHCQDSIMLLQEYASLGSLYELLQERNINFDEKILIEIFLQIIDAMIYLTKNNIVHGDLACRNILVFHFDTTNPKKTLVKLTDFGLSQYNQFDSCASNFAQSTSSIIPIRYAAPEIFVSSNTMSSYSEKSDIYSMGVLMWEAYSRGAIPWSNILDDQNVIRHVKNGNVLSRPPNCSEQYWTIILKTWS